MEVSVNVVALEEQRTGVSKQALAVLFSNNGVMLPAYTQKSSIDRL